MNSHPVGEHSYYYDIDIPRREASVDMNLAGQIEDIIENALENYTGKPLEIKIDFPYDSLTFDYVFKRFSAWDIEQMPGTSVWTFKAT